MAGNNPRFRPDLFREKIRYVFEMAKPPEADQQLWFHFTGTVNFAGPADGDSVPFDPDEAITRTVRAPLQRPCDVEFTKASDDPTAFGTIIPAKITVTLLDEDYDDVKEASFVVMGGDKYLRVYEPPSYGLFSVGLHTMVFVAENER